jgi:hypothetical protein
MKDRLTGLTDATRILTFEITDDDVLHAIRKDKANCVIAQALKATPGVLSVEVGITSTRITTADKVTRYRTPYVLRDALSNFDQTGHWDLPSGVYLIHPPQHHDRLDTIAKRNATHPKRKGHYKTTGRNKIHRVNSRVIEYAALKAATKAAEGEK